MNFFDSLGAAKATGIAILVWAIGLFMAGGAALEARIKADDRTKINLIQQSTPAKLTVKEEEVSAGEYNKSIGILKNLHPDIAFTTGRQGRSAINGIQMSISDLAAYYTFLIVIYDIMTTIPDARWQVEYICAGEGCGGGSNTPYQATLRAYRKQSVMQ